MPSVIDWGLCNETIIMAQTIRPSVET
jgi:hypothetical protein